MPSVSSPSIPSPLHPTDNTPSTSPPKRDSYVVHERGPRPVSNYHGGPRHSHNSVRRTSYVPAERVSYRSSHRSIPHSHRDYTRTSRTYVR